MRHIRVLAPDTPIPDLVREEGPFPFVGPAWGAAIENPEAHGNVRWILVYSDGSRQELNINAESEYGARYFWREIEEVTR